MPSPEARPRSTAVPADTGLRLAGLGIAWLLGIAAQLQQAHLDPVAAYVACTGVALLGLAFAGRAAWRPGRAALAVALLSAGLLGFGLTGLHAAWRLAERLPAALEGRDLVVTGVVAGLPRVSPQGTNFEFEVEQATLDGRPVPVPSRLALGWYRAYDDDALIEAAAPAVAAGQRWQLPVRLRQPHGLFNPDGFDLELWLFEQGLRASGTVRPVAGMAPAKLGDAAAHALQRARQRVRDAILLRVPDVQAGGVLAALAVGDQAAIDRDDWALFRDTGVAHLMSISGLHVTMFAWLAGGLIGAAWRRSARLATWRPAPVAARWSGVAAASAYALFAGWGVPAQRTVWMLAIVALLRSGGRRWPAPLVLLAAAVAVTALDPWALLQPGFWLSFAAVGLLMAADAAPAAPAPAASPWGRARLAVRAGLHTQAVATLGLAPLSMVFFQQVSVVGFAANLIAIPLVTLAITPFALAGIVLPVLWAPAAGLVEGLVAVLAALGRLPWGTWHTAAAPAWGAALGLLGGLLLVMPLPWRLRLLGLPLLLPLLAPPVSRPGEGRFEVVVADVGQGSAVLLRTREHLLVYDAGPRYSPEADAGQRVLLPLLRARGESRVDLLVLSHRDGDHVGGAATLMQGLRVGALLSSLDDGHALLRAGLPHRRCAAGQSWRWDGVRFAVLHPPEGERSPKPNALSCVLRIEGADGRSLLLTGDIEAAQEAALLARVGTGLRSLVLVVPHHGSRSSSTAAFIGAVAPGTALVQAGYRSRFGHPAPEIVERYRSLGVEVLRTDRCGAWTWSAEGSTRCERESAARYWHHRPESDADAPA